jgi:acyl carrier protein
MNANSPEITPRIERVFARVFGKRAPFSLDVSRLNEPKWTSLRHVEFLIGLEQEFGIRFDGADATDMTTILAVIERVQKKLP